MKYHNNTLSKTLTVMAVVAGVSWVYVAYKLAALFLSHTGG